MMRVLTAMVFIMAFSGSASGSPAEVNTCFTPAQRCGSMIVAAIDGARTEVLVQAYSFTSRPIVSALISAARRGVAVSVLVDKSEEPGKTSHEFAASSLRAAGIPVAVDSAPQIAHNKVLVIDGQRVVTGSYNFTVAAERKNAENVVVIDSPDVARMFRENWASRAAVSVPVR